MGEVLKISSEVHSFEKIDNIFALVLESLENLFADIGFGVVMNQVERKTYYTLNIII